MLGLDPRNDAGLGDVMTPEDALPVDALFCFGDSFAGPGLQDGWMGNLSAGISAAADGMLAFKFAAAAQTGTEGSISLTAQDLRERTVEVTLGSRPPSDVEARLTVGAYAMHVDTNQVAHLFVNGVERATMEVGALPRRIGIDLARGTATFFTRTGSALDARELVLETGVDAARISLGSFIRKTTSVAGEVRWDDISVTCGP